MRKVLGLCAMLALFPLAAFGQVYPSPHFQSVTVDKTITGGALGGSVSSNAALKALTGPVYSSVIRAGFSTPGDGGAASYSWTSTACSLNAGAGDDGSQVKPTSGTGCWMLQPGSLTDIRVWGATTGADIGPFIQASYNANAGCVYIPAGFWTWTTGTTMNAQAPCFKGSGWNEAVSALAPASPQAANATGTWITLTNTSVSPVTITSQAGQGGIGGFSNIAFFNVQPAPVASGWTPTAYPYPFVINGSLGRIDFDNLMFYNTTHCISVYNAARLHINNISGMPLGTCLQFDRQYDITYIQNIDFWTFWAATNPYVAAYNQANVDPILFLRSDSPFISRVFVFGYHSGLAFGQSTGGVTTGAIMSDLSTDSSLYGLWVQPGTGNVQLQISNLRVAGAAEVSGPLTGSEGYRDDGAGTAIDIANFDCYYAGSSCIDIKGTGRLAISNAQIWNFNNDNNGSPGIQAGTSGWVQLANQPNVVRPQNNAPVIPVTSLGGTYAIRGTRQYWTPTIVGNTTAGTATYGTQSGVFWYDGSQLTLNFNLSVTGFSGASGGLTLQGLPRVLNANIGQNAYCWITNMAGFTLTPGFTTLSGIWDASSGLNQILLIESGSGQNTIPVPTSVVGPNFVVSGSCTLSAGQ